MAGGGGFNIGEVLPAVYGGGAPGMAGSPMGAIPGRPPAKISSIEDLMKKSDKERQKELAENYRKVVLTSFQEVEDAMAALKAAHLRETSLATALSEARKAYDLSRQQYEAGAIDFQSVLNTQDALLSAQDSYAQTRLEALTASVDLYKALGGGWQ